MWLMTTRGFVSAVEWQERGNPKNGMIVLRARERGHLDSILSLLAAKKKDRPEVAVSPSADYRYRAWVTREVFEQLVVALAREVTYKNFKTEVMVAEGRKVKMSRYESALHSVWTVLGRIQPGGPYGRGGGVPIPKGEPKRAEWGGRLPIPERAEEGKAECGECGKVGSEEAFVPVPDGFVCRDVPGCLDRVEARILS